MSVQFRIQANGSPFTYEVIDADSVIHTVHCFAYQGEPNGMVSFQSLYEEVSTENGVDTILRERIAIKNLSLSNVVLIRLVNSDSVSTSVIAGGSTPVIPKMVAVNNKDEKQQKSENGSGSFLTTPAQAENLPEDAGDFDESYIPINPDANLMEESFDSPAEVDSVESWIQVTSGNDEYAKNKEHFKEAAKTFAQGIVENNGKQFELQDFITILKTQGYKEHADEEEMNAELCKMIHSGSLPTDAFINKMQFEHFKGFEPELSNIYDNSQGNLVAVQDYILKEEGYFSVHCDIIRICAYLKQKRSNKS